MVCDEDSYFQKLVRYIYLNPHGKDKKGQANYDSHQKKSTYVKVVYTTFLNMYINLAVGMVLLDIIVFPQRRNQSK